MVTNNAEVPRVQKVENTALYACQILTKIYISNFKGKYLNLALNTC